MAKQSDDVETLEQGNIYFLYRPRVEQDEAAGPEDVQNFYCVLSPQDKQRFRLLVIGREKLPDPGAAGKRKFWSFVSMVRKDAKSIAADLGAFHYDTKTRGRRHQAAARAAGEGVYQLVRHGDHTHLVYALELPDQLGEVQRDLGIAEQASYVLSVKNPEKAGKQAGLPKHDRAEFPKHLQERFAGRRFIAVEDPRFLDHEGAELLWISASDDVKQDLGIELEPQDESEASADIRKELGLSEHPLEPLFEGHWT